MKLIPTLEQEQIVQEAVAGTSLAVIAYAGAAKTSTCVMVAEQVRKSSLYVSFNKDIATEAGNKFPNHVICKTMHSLAWAEIIGKNRKAYGERLQGSYNFKDIPCLLQGDAELKFQFGIVEAVKQFCQSASYDLVEFLDNFKLEADIGLSSKQKEVAVNYWEDMTSKSGRAKLTHDVYLKMYQLGNPVLNYQVIYLDEAQDSNPVTLSIVTQQRHAQIILGGDSYQSIYEWRGAVNALDNLPARFKKLYLTESFRFTQEIADTASKLTYIAGNDKAIIGRATMEQFEVALKSGYQPTEAWLCRTNSTILNNLMDAYNNNYKIYVLADLTELWKKLYHISSLMSGSPVKFPSKELEQYSTWKELELAAETMVDLQSLIRITMDLSKTGLHSNITNLKTAIADRPEQAKYTISTIHKSKGLEWDIVNIADDALRSGEGKCEEQILLENQTLNLLYVAATRAKFELKLPYGLQRIVKHWEVIKDACEWYKATGESKLAELDLV